MSDEASREVDPGQMTTPTFTSSSQTLVVDKGDTVRLPCMVDRLEGFVMLWKKQSDIVTVADQIIDKVSSSELMSTSTLHSGLDLTRIASDNNVYLFNLQLLRFLCILYTLFRISNEEKGHNICQVLHSGRRRGAE